MPLLPKNEALIGIGGRDTASFSMVRLGKYDQPKQILVTANGESRLVSLEAAATVIPVLVAGNGESSLLSFDYSNDSPYVFGLYYSMPEFVRTRADVTLGYEQSLLVVERLRWSSAWTTWVPTIVRAQHSFSYFYALEIAHVPLPVAYNYGPLDKTTGGLTFGYQYGPLDKTMGGLTFGYQYHNPEYASMAYGFKYRMGKLSTYLKASIRLHHENYVVTHRHPQVSFGYECRNWDKSEVFLHFGMGVNQKVRGDVSLAGTMGVLKEVPSRVSVAHTIAQNTLSLKGFGAEYAAYSASDPVDVRWFLPYHIKEFDPVQVTLSWAQLATAKERYVSFHYAYTYAAFPEFRLSYARRFFTVFKHFTLAAYKHRFLLGGATIPMPFGVRAGVEITYSLQDTVGALVNLPMGMRDLICSGVRLGLPLEYIVSGVVLDTPIYASVGGEIVLGLPYSVNVRAEAVFDVPLHDVVCAGVELGCSLAYIASGVVLDLPVYASIRGELVLPLPYSVNVSKGWGFDLPIRASVFSGVVIPWDYLVTTPVSSIVVLPLGLFDTAPITQSGGYVLEDPTGSGEGLGLISGEVSAEEDSYGWTGTFVLSNPLDLLKFKPRSEFAIVIGGERFVFVVSSKELSREDPVNVTATLKGFSPALQLSAPMAGTITKTWTDPVMSHDLLKEVLGDFDVQLDILNWSIPANRYGVSTMDPIEVAKQVATAVGCVLDSLPSGTLRVRHKFPVASNLWASTAAARVLSDADDILTYKDEDVPLRVFNKFRVMDQNTASGSDKLDYSETTSTTGVVRAYPSPWRESVALYTTSELAEVVGGPTVEYREETETLEVYNGATNTRFPVTSVTSLTWLSANLLGVVAGNDSTSVTTTHTTEKFSMVKITYQTRCLLFDVAGVMGEKAQFLLKDV